MATLSLASDSAPPRHWEHQYLDLMRHIWSHGEERDDRTGVGTRSVFGAQLRFDLSEGRVPLLTTKRVFWKTAAREMLWFLTGDTNIRSLCAQGVGIWTDWPLDRFRRETGETITREDFSARIVADPDFAEKWGDLGPVYGKQWVDWDTFQPVVGGGEETLFRKGPGINQVAQVIRSLRENPGGRRHIIEGWNVAELDRMALPPCHKSYQFHVTERGLSCLLYQRSCDVALGLPFNLFGAALLTRMIAAQTGHGAHELVWMGGDTHLYRNHESLVQQQLAREPAGDPRLVIEPGAASIFAYAIEDFTVTGYAPQAAIRAPVAV